MKNEMKKDMTKSEIARREWNKANIKSVGTTLSRADADAFIEYAKKNNTTPGRLIRDFVADTMTRSKSEVYSDIFPERPREPWQNICIERDTYVRLMRFTQFHSNVGTPDQNVDALLNSIFDLYEKTSGKKI